MTQKTFTEKVIDVLVNGDMPTAKGAKATETGLIIVTSKMTAPVCASYGSSLNMIATLLDIMEQSESIRSVLTAVVFAYAKSHPDDPCVVEIKELMQ